MTMDLPRIPSFRLEGRRALVTGASRGIGLAAAAALAEAGAHVTLNARSASELDEVCAAIGERGGQCTPLICDVTDVVAFQNAVEHLPAFDIFVNNAGMNRPGPFLDVTCENFDAVMGLNVRAAFFAAQSVTRGMVKAGRGGTIINMSSQMGHVGGPGRTIYCTSKFAIEGFTKAAANDLAGFNIRVNSICPTFIETPMTRPFFENKEFLASVLTKIKLGRLGKVEDVMGAIVYLASDASSLVTGSSMMIDGGWTAD